MIKSRVTYRIDEDIAIKIKKRAIDSRMKLSDYVNKVLREIIEKKEGK